MAKETMDLTKLRATISMLASPDKPATSGEGAELGEVVSVSANWALNSIPSMTVVIPMGTDMDSNSPSYCYGGTLSSAFADRKPVGVYLESSKALPGLFSGKKCLFRGYIDSSSTRYEPNGGILTLTLRHWLADLDIFSILSRLSSPDNPLDISQDPVFNSSEYQEAAARDCLEGKAWRVGRTYRTSVEKGIFHGIMAGLSEAFGETKKLSEKDPGYVNTELYDKAKFALSCLDCKYLEYLDSDMQDKKLQDSIGAYLLMEQSSNYYSVTLWQKLIQTLLPSFYLGMIPLVDKAFAVPSPGINMTQGKSKPLTDDDIVSMQITKKGPSLLGGVFLTGKGQDHQDVNANPNKRILSYMYPDPPEPGVLKAITLPGWIANGHSQHGVLPGLPSGGFTKDAAAARAKSESKRISKECNLFPGICKNLAKAMYVSEVTSEHTAAIVTPLKLDYVPGDVVEVQVPRDLISDVRMESFFGIISSVAYTISKGSIYTNYNVTHIRTKSLMSKLGQSTAIIYKEGWRDTGDTSDKLYV